MTTTLEEYIQKLPQNNHTLIDYPAKWEQSEHYRVKEPILKKIERVYLPFAGAGAGGTTASATAKSTISHNDTLWGVLCSYIDENYNLTPRSYQIESRRYLISKLKEFMTQPDIRRLFTGRRMYPLLQLLDHPRCECLKNHYKAIGFLFSYLLNRIVHVEGEIIQYGEVASEARPIFLIRNPKGIWYDEADKK